MSEAKKPAKRDVDWDAIEIAFRAGVKTSREIGAEFGVSHTAVNNKAKEKGWTRDLSARIKQKAEEKVSKAALASEGCQLSSVESAKRRESEDAVVEANAELQYRVRMDARKDVSRNETLVRKLLDELEVVTDNRELFEKLGEILDESGPTENGGWKNDKQNEIYRKVISLTGRVDSAKKLVEMLEKLVALKFRVFGVKDEEGGAGNNDDLLLKAAEMRRARATAAE